MANFNINFQTNTIDAAGQDPIYRMAISTSVIGTAPAGIDGSLLVISRRSTGGTEQVDTFYGIVKAVDFAAMRKIDPKQGHTFYRIATWNLLFYNSTTLSEAKALMRSQIDQLSESVSILLKENNNRSETHTSPIF
jgi:hypothetical protein